MGTFKAIVFSVSFTACNRLFCRYCRRQCTYFQPQSEKNVFILLLGRRGIWRTLRHGSRCRLIYGINGILGFNLDWVNIAIYFIAVLYAHYTFYRYACLPYYNTFSYHKPHRPVPLILPVFVLVFVTFLFMLFTFYPPHIGLFSDPQNGSYGLSASLFTRYSYPSRMTALWSEASRVVCSIV